MNQEHLWAPWRLGFIKGELASPAQVERNFLPHADPACFLCRAIAEDASRDRDNLLVHRGPHAVTMLNRFPYNNGHLLVAPLIHEGQIEELSSEQHVDLQYQIAHWVAKICRLMNAEGFNVGLNLGAAAGAGLPGHLHWHVVPRWSGDLNFMPVTAGVKVLPQSLDSLWELLSSARPQP